LGHGVNVLPAASALLLRKTDSFRFGRGVNVLIILPAASALPLRITFGRDVKAALRLDKLEGVLKSYAKTTGKGWPIQRVRGNSYFVS
jgi:hypothetical protein